MAASETEHEWAHVKAQSISQFFRVLTDAIKNVKNDKKLLKT